ncbi:hypothetical protein BAUCODRAFT_576684 [Baudoinia panamericana UAMH 10762]|uniref:Uncharacterized protein n=1 Tax=Baudoinia panamericana (strain UAMH 10762) TaxID=717646 RepID=M2LQX9_BAUPA|nr:uncharacterized protein BAUCODRAFT_576684 [Baudoinia panamericana UAMH 10762]EMC96837.1 hypothetical protein BAUCODRAFT_576684 [Baudoinia panamericana UAMH 10762]
MASATSPGQDATSAFNPQSVDLTNADPAEVVCYLEASGNEYNGQLGARISALFVILVVSSAVTFFPVLATRTTKFKVPLYVYLFARYFGAGVIVATAFIHLLDPAYSEIGPNTCVGMTGGWAEYAWPPAIALFSCVCVFLMDFGAERYVEKRYGLPHGQQAEETDQARMRQRSGSVDFAALQYEMSRRKSSVPNGHSHQAMHSGDQDGTAPFGNTMQPKSAGPNNTDIESIDTEKEHIIETAFQQQIAAFLILEFGVIFHSVIIGLTLSTAGDEFTVLYPVIVFHQSFEGLGLGARLSAIPFPKRLQWLPWWLCAGYGLTTPIAIAIGLGVRTTYNAGSFTANIVSGVLDATSAGILIYTGLVELLARDFLFNPDRTHDDRQLAFMVVSVLLGAGIMALLGKWA